MQLLPLNLTLVEVIVTPRRRVADSYFHPWSVYSSLRRIPLIYCRVASYLFDRIKNPRWPTTAADPGALWEINSVDAQPRESACACVCECVCVCAGPGLFIYWTLPTAIYLLTYWNYSFERNEFLRNIFDLWGRDVATAQVREIDFLTPNSSPDGTCMDVVWWTVIYGGEVGIWGRVNLLDSVLNRSNRSKLGKNSLQTNHFIPSIAYVCWKLTWYWLCNGDVVD